MTAGYFSYKPIPTFASVIRTPVRAVQSNQPANLSALHLFLKGNIAPGWEMREQFPIVMEQDEDKSFIVSDSLFAVYGVADTQQDAIDDFVTSLIEYYEILAAHTDPPSQAQLQQLRFYVQPTAK